MPELGDINLVVLLGGPMTLAGFAWLAHMFVAYQRDFTSEYRQRLHRQNERIAKLEEQLGGLQDREHRLRLKLNDCDRERQALYSALAVAGVSWNPTLWNVDDDPA